MKYYFNTYILLLAFSCLLQTFAWGQANYPDTLHIVPTDTALVKVWMLKGDSLQRARRPHEAAMALAYSLAYADKIYGTTHPLAIHIADKRAKALADNDEFDLALQLLGRVLQYKKAKLGERNPELASFYQRIGECECQNRQKQAAFAAFQTGIRLTENAVRPDTLLLMSICLSLGDCQKDFGDYEQARANVSRASALTERLAETNPDKNKCRYDCLITLAKHYMAAREFQRAISTLQQALLSANAAYGDQSTAVSSTYRTLGRAYMYASDFEQALSCSRVALQLYIKRSGPRSIQVAEMENNIGLIYSSMGKYREAIYAFQQSLSIKLELPDSESATNLGATYASLSNNCRLMGDRANAVTYLQKSLAPNLHRGTARMPVLSFRYGRLGEALLGDPTTLPAAREAIRQAFKLIEQDEFALPTSVPTLSPWCNGLVVLAQWHTAMYEHDGQVVHLDSAIQFIGQFEAGVAEHFRRVAELDEKADLFSLYYRMFGDLIPVWQTRCALTNNPEDRASLFRLMELPRMLALFQSSQEDGALQTAGVPFGLLEHLDSLHEKRAIAAKALFDLKKKGVNEGNKDLLAAYHANGLARDVYRMALTDIQNQYPAYYQLRFGLEPAKLSDLQAHCLQKGQAIVQTYTLPTAIYVELIRSDTFVVRCIPLDSTLRDAMNQTLDCLTNGPNMVGNGGGFLQNLQLLSTAPHLLYQRLLGDIAVLLPEEIIVASDGLLQKIPFELLLGEVPTNLTNFNTWPWFLRGHHCCYAASASQWQRSKSLPTDTQTGAGFVAFAPFATIAATSDHAFAPLPFSAEEVTQAQLVMGGKVFMGAAATQAQFLALAANSQYIHIASHGHHETLDPDFSYIAFAPIQGSVDSDLFYLRDLYRIKLHADLVVLSACQTGNGRQQYGAGLHSIARAFRYAGARSVLSSLWNANDAHTQHLMRFFYQNLQTGMPKNRALQMAKRSFIREYADEAHPFYWAGFM